MKLSALRSYKTGVLVPVHSLRTAESAGAGEFLDLCALGEWCIKTGLDLVQLLPVNDTGDDASPYNALSAFALQPVYCRVQALPEYAVLPAKVRGAVDQILDSLRSLSGAVDYRMVRTAKLEAMNLVYQAMVSTINKDADLDTWLADNAWAREYGVFMALKDRHQHSGWKYWKEEYRRGSPEIVEKLWKSKDLEPASRQWAWIQYRLEAQFLDVARWFDKHKLILKGDIPIMMNEDSVDVWVGSSNFNLDLRAGAPPDMFSHAGQNWGFPIYNWDYLASHDYVWWRQRLRQADKFYHAFRIDHVLGFFRIWSIPQEHYEGLLGHFNPSIHISTGELAEAGFDKGRIRWLAEPHIPGQRLQELFGMRSFEIIGRCFDRIGNEELYLFKPEITGERMILDLPLMDDEKQHILAMYRDRALLSVADDLYSPAWNYRDCWRYQIMGEKEKNVFGELITRHRKDSEALWQQQGERLLGFMQKTVPMLACAEDLGVVPDCVPVSLKKLGILSLKIPRWAKRYDQAGEPYIAPVNYPFLSVCAASVHDTSTLRQWWEDEADREAFWLVIGARQPCSRDYDTGTAREMFRCLLQANSAIVVFQIQDFLALHDDFRAADAKSERMNVPGTVGPANWSWRLPFNINDLIAHGDLNSIIKTMVADRKKRAITKDN